MATIVTRAGKGSALTHAEVDANFTGLNSELATKANSASPSFTGKSQFPASTSTGAAVNLGSGANVTSNLVDGDVWVEGNNFRWQANGTTWRASAVGHVHAISGVTGLQTALDLKVDKTSSTGAAALPASTTGDRPGTPLAGYIRYNTTTGKFEGYGSAWGNIGGGASIGDTPPANPGAGDLWWNSADGRMYVYYTDANSSQWVDLSAGGAGQYLPLTGGTVTGNIEIAGTGRRITADFGNATFSNRFFFQSNAVNTQTALGVLPNGTSQQSQIYCWNNSDASAANAGVGLLASTTDARIQAQVANGGTALPLTFYTNSIERMRIDASGNVGIGASSPSTYGRLAVMTPTTGYGYFGIANSVGGGGGVQMAQYYGTAKISYIDTTLTNGTPGSETSYLAFGTANSGTLAERARITNSGDFLVGTTTSGGKFTLSWNNSTQQGFVFTAQTTTFNGSPVVFYNSSGGLCGFIGQTASSVSYNTSSDYRLKENVQPIQNALEKVALLNPVTYTWKADGSAGQGFIAHELQEVVPDCVTGEKDAVDVDNNPRYQGVDASKLVATLTKAIQELNAKVDALQSELNAIKGGE